MSEVRFHTCMLCEASCGLAVELEGSRVVSVRGDRDDRFSRGHICPKAAAIDDIRHDPDRVTTPLRRTASGWQPVSWDSAFNEASERLDRIRQEHGRHAIGVFAGNPMAHSYTGLFGLMTLIATLRTRSRFSSTSTDQLPHMLAGLQVFGHQLLLPVPDIDRTRYFLVLGANPVVSNGSLMTAPDITNRLKALRGRGGKLVVVDPRRTETAALADTHLAIRPGTDALFLAALVRTVFEERLEAPGRLGRFMRGLDKVLEAVAPYAPEAVADATGIAAALIRRVAGDFARASSAVAYGRVGLCTQEFGAVSAWLVVVLNAITGNLDRAGGAMFTTPAVDLVKLASLVGHRGSFGWYASRVRALPEFGGELPTAVLAEEIETPGPGQIRALITAAGNPVLSAPNGRRLERALAGLDFMVSVDLYRNETTRFAHLILPTSFGFERDHYDVALYALAVRNVARYAPALMAPAGDTRLDWDVFFELASRLDRSRGGRWLKAPVFQLLRRLGPRRMLDGLLRFGAHGLSLSELESRPHGIDLGPLEPRLPGVLPLGRIELGPQLFMDDMGRLRRSLAAAPSSGLAGGLVLI
ncbi:MAG: molybdopterin-dependent oxidoreductase, partial [Myxococcales bacterium]